jgi:ubiquitin C-terminal hydrolase
MWSEDCTIAPWGFVNGVKRVASMKGRTLFTGAGQNDVSEFLGFLLESFHMALARGVEMSIKGKVKNARDKMAQACYGMMKRMYEKEYSELLSMFYGISVSQIVSVANGDLLSATPEPFSTLELEIPAVPNPTVFDCLNEYCKDELLTGENAYFNEATRKKEDAKRRFTFWTLPPVLIIGLKRFTYHPTHRKIQTLVQAPLDNADFSPYVCGYKGKRCTYELYGVCNHVGGVQGGHYTAHAKGGNGRWDAFNDTIIMPCHQDRVVTSAAYYFFYRKKK